MGDFHIRLIPVAFLVTCFPIGNLLAAPPDTRPWNRISEQELADRVREAKAAAETLFAACERWAARRKKAKTPTPSEAGIYVDADLAEVGVAVEIRSRFFAADNRFNATGTAAGYGPLQACYRAEHIVGAGSFTLDDGRVYSFTRHL